jgi:arsenite methyltransferase
VRGAGADAEGEEVTSRANKSCACQAGRTGQEVHETVRAAYAGIATGGGSCCGPKKSSASSCGCGSSGPEILARKLGYSDDELAALPEGANMGLSCGNPAAVAALRPGEVVLDLGSGGGFDVFVCAQKVGPKGRAIGVDMTAEKLSKARRNANAFRERTGLANVEFRLGEIEHLPVADASVDVIISNCVVNLSPDKPQVWREMARVLRPGGRVAVSDLALLKPLPEAVRESVNALVGCVAGSVLVEETGRMAREAGLTEVALAPRAGHVDAMFASDDPLYREVLKSLPAGARVADYVVSLEISARKPR